MRKSEFHPSEIPPKPGGYIYRDRFGKVIYVGKASNLRRRMSSYFQPSRIVRADAKLRSLIHSIEEFSYEVVRTEDEALILESQLIKSYAPYYNILMRDDKRYLLLKLDRNEKFPPSNRHLTTGVSAIITAANTAFCPLVQQIGLFEQSGTQTERTEKGNHLCGGLTQIAVDDRIIVIFPK